MLSRLVWIGLFSLGAIVDDLTGWVFNVDSGEIIPRPPGLPLQPRQAIVDLRDLTACVAGLAGGMYIGPAVGVIAGGARVFIGGEFGLSAGLATVVIGCLSAWLHHRHGWIRFAPGTALLLGLAVTAVQRGVILLVYTVLQRRQLEDLLPLFRSVTWPKAVTNACGCAIFAWIMQVVDTDKKSFESQQHLAERNRELAQHMITSYLGQIQPHFLSNALNNLRPLLFDDSTRADEYIVKLGRFFRDTHTYAATTVIPLHEELRHVTSYVELQKQRFGEQFRLRVEVRNNVHQAQIPPHTLLALIENCFNHAMQKNRQLDVRLKAWRDGDALKIEVDDNGPGYPVQLLDRLGKQKVTSNTEHGTGTALYRLEQVLSLIYPAGLEVAFSASESGGACARIRMPLELNKDEPKTAYSHC